MKSKEHIVLNAKAGGFFECLHCKDQTDPGYPIHVGEIGVLIDEYTAKHIDCSPGKPKTLIFTGYSDDIVSVDTVYKGPPSVNTAEYSCLQMGSDLVHGEFLISLGYPKMKIYALYDGCWSFAVSQVEEDTPLPDWPVRLVGSKAYSSILEIDVPRNAALDQIFAK